MGNGWQQQQRSELCNLQIPDSIEDAVLDLKGIGELVTASEWQRAAIVWAFTADGRGKSKDVYSVTNFAALGIAGLASKPSVIKYRKAWSRAIEDGFATDVRPGDLIDLPEVEWQPYFNPKGPVSKKTPAKRGGIPVWDEDSWDGEGINTNKRVVKMSEVMWDTLDGVEDEKLVRVAQSIIDFVGDENKARGMARMMHSVIEFASEYKSAHRGHQ